jgi:hypothetical protein
MKAWNNLFGTDAADQRRIQSRQKAPVVKEGALDKLKGFIGVGKVWTQQYFILQCDALYFCSNKDFSHKSKKVCMVDVVIDLAEKQTRRQYSFAIYDGSMHSLCIMAAENELIMHDWIAALNRVRLSLRPVDLVKCNVGHLPPITLSGNDVVSSTVLQLPSERYCQAKSSSQTLPHRLLTSSLDGSNLADPTLMQSKPQEPAPELTQIWKSVVSTSTRARTFDLELEGQDRCFDYVPKRAAGVIAHQSLAHSTAENGLQQRDYGLDVDNANSKRELFVSHGHIHMATAQDVLEHECDTDRRITNSKNLKALVQMGFDYRESAAALNECEGLLDEAVISLSRRTTRTNGNLVS